MQLEHLGWNDTLHTGLSQLQDAHLMPARVCASQREHYRLSTGDAELNGQLGGAFRHRAGEADYPVTGDWVAVRLQPHSAHATIVDVLPRRSTLIRKRADRTSHAQVLAANLDAVLLVTSLNHDFNPRRIERALAMIWEGGAQPVLLLSKLDLCDAPDAFRAEAERVALGVPVLALSALHRHGLEQLEPYLQPARTLALIGSSGVGKSTLLNALMGHVQMPTQAIRAHDGRGRHTTTSRELFVLPGGALLIDTPGIRELGLVEADAGLRSAFEDIDALAEHCRFPDCQHGSEPGCSVRDALANGSLDERRYRGYLKLQRELAYEARRLDERAQLEHRTKMRRVFRERKRHTRQLSKK